MSLDVKVLRSSFELVVERQPKVTHRFYEIPFESHPEVRPLFKRRSAEEQEKMRTQALVAVMDHREDAAWLGETLAAMGAKHAGYGVTEEMYGWVGAALLATLAEVAAEASTTEVEVAWQQAYAAIATLMQEGARSAAA